MKEIELTQGKRVRVDDADFEKVSQYKWFAVLHHGIWHAQRAGWNGGHKRTIRMHRQIMGAQLGQQVDHADRDGLNNQRENLRFCTNSQNRANSKKQASCSSIYKGVTWHKQVGKWQAGIRVHGKQIHLGLFTDAIEAAFAYNVAAIERFGEFARLNVIEG